MRAMTSVLPPAAYPRTTVTGLAGQSVACARAEYGVNNAAKESVATSMPHACGVLDERLGRRWNDPAVLDIDCMSPLLLFARALARHRLAGRDVLYNDNLQLGDMPRHLEVGGRDARAN
jgi:hypothetical protein